jgi:hypothetical protein
MAIYFNGQEASTQTVDAQYSSIFNSTAPLWIGQQFNTSVAATFEGRIDEAAIYNKVLPANEILNHFLAATGAFVSNYAWNVNASGGWGTLSNWNPGSVPNSNGVTVTFGNVITLPQTVFVESSVIAKTIEFNNANKYALAGTGEIVLAADTGSASISVTQGNHEFQAPVQLQSNTNVNVAAGSLTFNNVLDLNGKVFTIQSGTVNIRNIVLPGAGGSIVNGASLGGAGAMAIGGGFTNEGTLNVDLGGIQAGQFSSFDIGGTAILGGSLFARLVDGFTPSMGADFTVLTADNLIDNGITLTGPLADAMSLRVVGNSLVLTAVPEPATLGLLCIVMLAVSGRYFRPRR